jgi:hypothetical protein
VNFDGASLAVKIIFAERVSQPEKAPQILRPPGTGTISKETPRQAFLAENLLSIEVGMISGAGLGRYGGAGGGVRFAPPPYVIYTSRSPLWRLIEVRSSQVSCPSAHSNLTDVTARRRTGFVRV